MPVPYALFSISSRHAEFTVSPIAVLRQASRRADVADQNLARSQANARMERRRIACRLIVLLKERWAARAASQARAAWSRDAMRRIEEGRHAVTHELLPRRRRRRRRPAPAHQNSCPGGAPVPLGGVPFRDPGEADQRPRPER